MTACNHASQVQGVVYTCLYCISHNYYISVIVILSYTVCTYVQVGPSYGRRTLTGLLRSEGVIVGEQRVRSAMTNATPVYIQQRQQRVYRQMNPVPYYAEYFGHKLHLDQNE